MTRLSTDQKVILSCKRLDAEGLPLEMAKTTLASLDRKGLVVRRGGRAYWTEEGRVRAAALPEYRYDEALRRWIKC